MKLDQRISWIYQTVYIFVVWLASTFTLSASELFEGYAPSLGIQIIFIDKSVEGSEDLVVPDMDRSHIVYLEPDQDGIEQVSSSLSHFDNVSSVHFVSHAEPGVVQLGSTSLDRRIAEERSKEILKWNSSFTPDTDILFYGCSLAAGTGTEILQYLGDLLSTDIKASVDLTASKSNAGNWDLEYEFGNVETPLAFDAASLELSSVVLTLPPGFANELVLDGLTQPIDIAALPNGSILVVERRGVISITDPSSSSPVATTYLTLPNVDTSGEKGLLSIALDPNFDQNNYFYVYYHNSAVDRARVSRFTQSSVVASNTSEFVIWEDNVLTSAQETPLHWGGAFGFGPDGFLYLAVGDKWDFPQDTQDLSKSSGKILRFNTEGAVPGANEWSQVSDNAHLVAAGNPYIDGIGGNLDEIWAVGLRNPFSGRWDLPTNRFFIGEVGNNVGFGENASYEDFHVVSPDDAGTNFGYPTCEGPICLGDPPDAYSPPVYSIQHPTSFAIIVGPVYRGQQFPTEYNEVLFFTDYAHGYLKYLKFEPDGTVSPDTPIGGYAFGDDDELGNAPVALTQGTDGALYYVDFYATTTAGNGGLRRIVYNDINEPPVIQQVSADDTTSLVAPFTVNFSATAIDPEGYPLVYSWDFGDGSTPAIGQNVEKTFESNGTYSVVLRVSDELRTAISDPVLISIGAPPEASIIQPVENSLFRAGDIVSLRGIGVDPDSVLSNEQFRWTINFRHNTHVHPVIANQPGEACLPSGSTCFEFTIPSTGHDFSEDTSYDIILEVTDSDGAADTAMVSVVPDEVFVTLTNNIPGETSFLFDQLPRSFPFTVDTLIGFEHTFTVPEAVTRNGEGYRFVSWSDGVVDSTRSLLIPDSSISLSVDYENIGAVRVEEGIQVLYTFDEGEGDTVFDVSGVGEALDLLIPDAGKVSWGEGTLSTIESTRIETAGPVSRLRTALQSTNELTLEAWIAPSNVTQGGPAPIVTMSYTPFYRSIALHQNADAYEVNLSTPSAGNQGNRPTPFASPDNAVQTDLMHVVYTRDVSGAVRLYIDDQLVSSGQVNGTFSDWRTETKLALGNELLYFDRPWLGAYDLLAIYDRALSAEEVSQNYAAATQTGPVENVLPVAINDAVLTEADALVSGNVLDANGGDADSDANGDSLTVVALNGEAVTALTLSSGALVTLVADGDFSYDPNGQYSELGGGEQGTDSFEYTISDGQGGESTATVLVTIRAANVPPLAQADDVTTDEDTLLTGDVFADNGGGVDEDANADVLVVTQVNGNTGSVGTEVTLASGALLLVGMDGQFSYDPNKRFDALNPGEQGTDSFSYTISDGRGGESTAVVSVLINGLEEPAILPRVEEGIQVLYTFDEGEGDTVFDVSGVGEALDLLIPDAGKVSWGEGTLSTIESTRIETAGPVSRLRTALQSTNELTLEAWIAPSNVTQGGPAPIVTMSYTPFYRSIALHQNADAYEVNLSTPSAGNQGNRPTPFASPDNAVQTDLMHVVYTRDVSGAVRLYIDDQLVSSGQVNGTFSDWRTETKLALGNELLYFDRPWLGAYDLLAIYDRALSAEEVSQNYAAATQTGPVENVLPVAINDAVLTEADALVSGNVLDANGGDADSDANGDSLTVVALNGEAVTALTLSSGALVTLVADGDFSYDPNGQYSELGGGEQGTDSFEYTISDGQGGESTATVLVTIRAANVPPLAQADDVTTDEDTLLTGDVFADNGGGVDEDANADVLVVTQVNGNTGSVGTEVTLASGALLLVGMDGQFSYDPNKRFDALNPGEQGTDSFSYTISDGRGGESTAVVSVLINGLEEPAILPRVEEGIQVLYTFDEGEGDTVFDVSGVGEALDLLIPDAGKVSWGEGTLSTIESTRIETAGPVSRLRTALQSTNELTLEAWIAPSNVTQGGPAPIVTMSYTPFYRSIALHQNADAYEVNLSTPSAGNQGNRPTPFASPDNAVQTDLMHVVYTRDVSGAVRLYIDDQLVSSGQVNGTFSDWRTETKLALGNELLYFDRPWLGAYDLLAIYDRALSAEEVSQNYAAATQTGPVENVLPVAINDAVLTEADALVSGNVLDANGGDADSDANGDSLTVVALNGEAVTALTLSSGALVTLVADGDFSYDPNGQYSELGGGEQGTDSFEYTISDGQGGESTATVLVTIRAANVPPLAQADDVTTDEDTLLTGDVFADNGGGVDEDANADVLVVTQVNGNTGSVGTEVTLASGALLLVGMDGQFSYDPNKRFDALNPGEQGTDSFSYTISDGRGGESTAVVSVLINGLEEPAILPRVEEGIQVLYTFDEGEGDTVFDVSGVGEALDLLIPDAGKVSWGEGTLSTIESTRIETAGPVSRLRTALQSTNELTLEAWIAPSNVTQGGPAPIVTMSYTPFYRSIALHQNADAYEVNLSTPSAGNQGNRPTPFASPDNAVQTDLMHVVYTRDVSGAVRLYIDDQLVSSGQVNGTFSDWRTETKLALGNELLYFDRPWLGAYDLLAIYDRALSAEEVSQNYIAGAQAGGVDNTPLDVEAPAVPQNFLASQITSTGVTLEWDTVLDTGGSGLAGFRIYRDGILLGESIVPIFEDTGLDPGTSYTYSVSAFDAAELANESATVTLNVTTEAAPSVPIPVNVEANVKQEQVALTWQPGEFSGLEISHYEVRKDGVIVASVYNQTNYLDSEVVVNTVYDYTVRSVDTVGNVSEWSEPVLVNVNSIPTYASAFDGELPLAGMFYGNYEFGLYTGNASIGYESSRRFRAEKTGFIQSVKYNNRTLTQEDITSRCENNGLESLWCLCANAELDPYTCGYTLGNSYTVGNGGSIVVEIHGDKDGLPDEIPLGRTEGIFIPQDNSDDIYPELVLENSLELVAGRTYHLVYRNLTPPDSCALTRVSIEEAASCPRDQGAMGLNGTTIANSGSPLGTFDPYRGNTPANFFKAERDGEWQRDFNNLSWYEVLYSDGTWVGDSYTAFDSSTAGENKVEGEVLARQRFTVQDADRIVDGVWLNFGHASAPMANGDSLKVLLKNEFGEELADGEISASETCRNMAVEGISSQVPAQLYCRDWGYASFDQDIVLNQGSEFSVEFSASQGAAFVLSAYFPLDYGPWQSTSRNHWKEAMAEISIDEGLSWDNWTTNYVDRDLGLLFTIKDKPRSLAPPDIEAPSVPQGLSASLVASTKVTLQWSVSSDTGGSGLAGYRVLRDGVLVGEPVAAVFEDTGLIPEESYTYSVMAYDAAEPANESAMVDLNVITVATPGISAPVNVEANVTQEQVALTWQPGEFSGSGISHYEVRKDGVIVASVYNQTNYPESEVVVNTVYEYAVRSVDTDGEVSEWSEVVLVAIDTLSPGVPQELQAIISDLSDAVTLSWAESTDTGGSGLGGYSVYRDGELLAEGVENVYVDTTVVADSVYQYTVSAYDNASPRNESLTATIDVQTPTTVNPDAGYECLAVTPALVSHYRFDSSDLSVLDDAGTPIAGSSINVQAVSGQLAGAGRFTASSEALAGQSDFGLTTGLSVSMWVKPSTLNSVEARYLSQATGVRGADHHLMVGAYAGDALRFRLKTGGVAGVTTTLISTGGQLEVDQWSFVTFTYDGQSMRIYNDGQLVAQRAKSGAVVQVGSVPLALGNQPPGAGDRPFLGDMDDVRIYASALSEQEIGQLMAYRLEDCVFTPDEQAPSVPDNVQASVLTPTSVTLGWTASVDTGGSGLAGYRVLRDGVLVGEPVAAVFEDTGLTPEESYTYSVSAFDGAEPANESAAASVTIDTPLEPDTQAPSVPGGFMAVSVSAEQVELIWEASTDVGSAGLSGYEISRDGVLLSATSGLSYTDENPVALSTHQYSLVALDSAVPANESTASTVSVSIPAVVGGEPPETPQLVAAFDITSSSVRLSWKESVDADGSSVAEYAVYRDGRQIGTAVGTEYADTSLVADLLYSYQVSAIDSSVPPNESGLSALVSVATLPLSDSVAPSVPQNLISSILPTGATLFSWQASSDNASGAGLSGYRLYKNDVALDFLSNEPNWTEQAVGDGQPTTYAVSAVDKAGNESAKSNSLTETLSLEIDEAPTPSNLFDAPQLIFSPSATSVAWGDIDQDNDLDITVVEGGKFHSNGPVMDWFEAPYWGRRAIGETLTPYTGDSKLDDVDADGDLDYIVSVDTHSGDDNVGRVYWYENNGSYFTNWPQHLVEANVPDAFHIGELQTGDIDGDGMMDIAIRHLSAPRFVLYFQNSDGSWTIRRMDTVHREGLELADLDGDGKMDIIANGFILFAPENPRVDVWPEVVFDSAYFSANPVDLNNSTRAAAGDLSGDGKVDIVITAGEGEAVYLAWYENPANSRTGNWTRTIIETPQTGNHQVLLGDVDMDGDLDLVGGFSFGETGVYWWDNINGDGTSFDRRQISATTGCYSCVLGDYDGDGDLDVMGPTQFVGPVYLYRNRATELQ